MIWCWFGSSILLRDALIATLTLFHKMYLFHVADLFFQFLSNGKSVSPEILWCFYYYYYASSHKIPRPMGAWISRKMRNCCRWKSPISWKIHIGISWNFVYLVILPQFIYHKTFRTNGCTVWNLLSDQFLPCFTLHAAQCCNKNICHELILRPNWVL